MRIEWDYVLSNAGHERCSVCVSWLFSFKRPSLIILQSGLPLKVKVKVSQSCLTLCDPMDYTVHGVLQARILEWVAFPFSRGSSQPRNLTGVSCIAGGFFTREALNWMKTIWPTKPECLLSGPLQKQVCQLLANLCFSNLSTQRSRMGSVHKISNKVTGSTQGILLKHRFY